MENKQNFVGFVGPSNVSRSSRYDAQRTVNMYMELAAIPDAKGSQPAVLINTPGLKLFTNLGIDSPIRGIYTISNSNIAYVVCENKVFLLNDTTSSTITPLQLTGTLGTITGTVQMSDNGQEMIIVDGQYGYYVNIAIGTVDNVVYSIISENFFPTQTITFQDSYFIGVEYETQGIFVSNPNDVTFPALNVAFKEGSPDIAIAAINVNRQLYVLGSKSFEAWWNSGQSAVTPFQRQDGRNSQFGCVAPYSVQILGDSFYWLGSNAQGGGVVFTVQNSVPTRISTNAVEFALQNYGDLSLSTAYTYQQEGHFFYVLNVPGADTTWVYDVGTNLWSERQSTINGVTGRHLAENHCVLNGQHLVGDYSTGLVYMYDLNTYTDNGTPIYRIRQSPHSSMNLNRMFYKLMEIDFQFGVGIPNTTDANPTVALQISRDGGQTFGNPIYSSLGYIGAYYTRCRFQRLGSGRDLIFKITVTAPVKVQMLSAYLDVEQGNA